MGVFTASFPGFSPWLPFLRRSFTWCTNSCFKPIVLIRKGGPMLGIDPEMLRFHELPFFAFFAKMSRFVVYVMFNGHWQPTICDLLGFDHGHVMVSRCQEYQIGPIFQEERLKLRQNSTFTIFTPTGRGKWLERLLWDKKKLGKLWSNSQLEKANFNSFLKAVWKPDLHSTNPHRKIDECFLRNHLYPDIIECANQAPSDTLTSKVIMKNLLNFCCHCNFPRS